MQVDIKSCMQWAKDAEGIAVIMDVFRASNTILSCIANDAEYIIPVATLEEAFSLKKQFPDHILFGERHGLIAEWCEYGNSPVEASRLWLKGKKIILTTSAGSQGVVNANLADEILVWSFANANAIIKYIKNKNPEKVSLIAIGLDSMEIAEEDELCWRYIRAMLLWENMDFDEIKKEISECSGADRLRSLYQEDDLELCTKLDIYDIVPSYNKETKKITRI